MAGTQEWKKRGRGRPTIAPEARRSHTIAVKVTSAERAELERRSASAGLREIGVYVRQVAIRGRPPRAVVPAVNREAWRELARTTANLNQIAAHLNGGGHFDERGTPRLAQVLDALREEVRLLRLSLIGPMDEGEEEA